MKRLTQTFAVRGMMGALGVTVFSAAIAIWQSTAPHRESAPVAEIEMQRFPHAGRSVALTFDAGGETAALPALLKALDDAEARCTFFVTGRWASAHGNLLASIVSGGHEIGNHSWSHPVLTNLADEQIREELRSTEDLLLRLTGRSPLPLFRAPFGERDDRVLRIIREFGYVSIYWSLDSLDSVEPPKSRDFLVQRITSQSDAALSGGIILMHVGEPATAEAVPLILKNLRSRGFTFQTVSSALALAREGRSPLADAAPAAP